jgi:hypothetical protein
MYRKSRLILSAALLALGMSSIASAAILFSDDFSTDDSASWNINKAPTANAANQQAQFAFDYSGFGIPAAPGSSDTKGLRLRANIPIVGGVEVNTRPAGATSGLSVSPTGKNFGSSYEVSFYAWSNFNGAANASGLADNGNSEGGTNNVMFALGTSGTVPLAVGNTGLVTNGAMDGIGFATTGDGGITNDYRVYEASGTFAPVSTGIYPAGSNSNTAAYYQAIPSLAPHSAPAIQQALATAEYAPDGTTNPNPQAGQTQIGAFGFAWHKVVLTKNGNTMYWQIDGSLIAQGDISAVTLGGNNIAFGVSDVNTSTTRHPSLLFTLIDNVQVTDTVSVPEPSTICLCVLGAMGLAGARRRSC